MNEVNEESGEMLDLGSVAEKTQGGIWGVWDGGFGYYKP